VLVELIGGRGGIRTHGGIAPSLVFKTSSLNRSDTLPHFGLTIWILPEAHGHGVAGLITSFKRNIVE
jgi:hypothetical protein